jgi:hypothetical protein
VKHVLVKMTRILKFRSHGDYAQVLGEPIQRFVIFQKKYDGLEANVKQEKFSKNIAIDLAEIFCLKRETQDQ